MTFYTSRFENSVDGSEFMLACRYSLHYFALEETNVAVQQNFEKVTFFFLICCIIHAANTQRETERERERRKK